MEQLNFNGEWVEPEEPKPQIKQTMKSAFRELYGYKEGYKCKQCEHFVKGWYHTKNLIKCEKLGLTHSKATDIREKDTACNLFELKTQEELCQDTTRSE